MIKLSKGLFVLTIVALALSLAVPLSAFADDTPTTGPEDDCQPSPALGSRGILGGTNPHTPDNLSQLMAARALAQLQQNLSSSASKSDFCNPLSMTILNRVGTGR
ncbi:MAG: hypothetical protein HY675_01855 [Chloroflexi bacterium]|nr:hypothetical protein [Chloroflexota bacterium]